MIIVQPPDWPRPRGYSNGIAARGLQVFIAGQVGWNPRTEKIESDDFVAQFRSAIGNVAAVLQAAGARPEHVTRLVWYITSSDEYVRARSDVGTAYREVMGNHYPAMTVVVVASLIEARAKVEIEATAVIPEDS
jgi:enamine deaminase RidA (YjgF/YER057c/UK114 family)